MKKRSWKRGVAPLSTQKHFCKSVQNNLEEWIKMSRFIKLGKKLRLAKRLSQTKWAPFWTVPKKYGKGKKIHPGRHTAIKRSWRRTKTKA